MNVLLPVHHGAPDARLIVDAKISLETISTLLPTAI